MATKQDNQPTEYVLSEEGTGRKIVIRSECRLHGGVMEALGLTKHDLMGHESALELRGWPVLADILASKAQR